MKTRIASSIAIAAAIVLGATGCGLVAPQGTTDPYAPSDGIEASFSSVDIRNLLLVVSEDGENFNVVFTGVNAGTSPVQLRMTFVTKNGSSEATADFIIESGIQPFGSPDGDNEPVFVSLPGVAAGDTVQAYLQVPGSEDIERQVPVLDGTLAEYRDYVLPDWFTAPPAKDEKSTEGVAETKVEEVAVEVEETE